MAKYITVSLEDHFNEYLESRVLDGGYKSASNVIRAGLRLLEAEEDRLRNLKKVIQEGIGSGIAQDFNPQMHLEMLKAGKQKYS